MRATWMYVVSSTPPSQGPSTVVMPHTRGLSVTQRRRLRSYWWYCRSVRRRVLGSEAVNTCCTSPGPSDSKWRAPASSPAHEPYEPSRGVVSNGCSSMLCRLGKGWSWADVTARACTTQPAQNLLPSLSAKDGYEHASCDSRTSSKWHRRARCQIDIGVCVSVV